MGAKASRSISSNSDTSGLRQAGPAAASASVGDELRKEAPGTSGGDDAEVAGIEGK